MCYRSRHEIAFEVEADEARANGFLATGLRQLLPNLSSDCLTFADGAASALFYAPHSDMNYVVGMAMRGESRETLIQQCETVEQFYHERGADFIIQTTSYACAEILSILGNRGYAPREFSEVYIHTLDIVATLSPNHYVELIVKECPLDQPYQWAETAAVGFSETGQINDQDLALFLGFSTLPSVHLYLCCDQGGQPMGSAAMAYSGDHAALFAGSTLPQYRRRGVQSRLLTHRLVAAKEQSMRYATVQTDPNTTSSHNVERQGFSLIYTKLAMHHE